MVKPKKHLGQHFLTDPGIASRIVDALDAPVGSTVLEIGPGTGVLTGFLQEKDYQLSPIEIDTESVAYLKDKWPSLDGAIIEGDFLKLDLEELFPGDFHVIGNFPYNISSQIFFRILDQRSSALSVVCMLQKEVADRIAAPPGKKVYGILSVLLQAFYEVDYLFTVKPGSFFPPPRVNSAVIRLRRREQRTLDCDEALFFRVVKSCFNQRRKMIRNSIRAILLNLDGECEFLEKRPEQLSVADFVRLTQWTHKNLRP